MSAKCNEEHLQFIRIPFHSFSSITTLYPLAVILVVATRYLLVMVNFK